MDNDKVCKLYGENLKRIRLNNNFTQEQASQITQLEAKYISQIERGVNTGTIITMLKFCKGYDITPNNLFNNIIKDSENKKDIELLNEKITRLSKRDRKIITNLVDSMLSIEK